MEQRETIRKLEKLQTLIEDLTESWPEGNGWAVPFDSVQQAGRAIDDAINTAAAAAGEEAEW